MNAIFAVARRELYSFFVSLRAYVILTLGLALFTLFFSLLLADGREASMRSMFKIMEFLFLTICPILTMGLLAEEQRSGTIELLRTAPVSRPGVVMGKYFGAGAIFALLVASTFHFYGVLEHYGAPDRWPVITGYIGLFLEGGLLLSIGLFASSLTSSQAVAGLLTYVFSFAFFALAMLAPYIPEELAPVVTYWGLGEHTTSLACGLVETQDLVYFLSLTGFFLVLAIWKFRSHDWMERGALRFAGSALAVALLAANTVGFNWAGHKYNVRWDVTKLKTHTLTDRTKQILATLPSPAKVTALYPGMAPEALVDLFGEFERCSGGRVATEIVDPLQNLGYASQFGNKIDASERRVIVQVGKTREEIDTTEKGLDESRLAAALFRASTETSKVYFLAGHNEYDFRNREAEGVSKVADSLEQLNLKVEKLELATAGKIPSDCRVLVIAGSRTAPAEEEIKEIERYLDDGGHAMFLVESAIRVPGGVLSDQEKRLNPAWNEVLGHWGITVGDDVVIDLSNHLGQDIGCPATSQYPDHDKIVKGLGVTFYVRPRSVSFKRPSNKQVLYAPLVQSAAETSWAETDKTLYTKFDAGQDTAGPVGIAGVLLQDPKTWKDGKSTKLVVIGDADFVTNQYTNKYSNLDLVVNAIAWLAAREILPGEDIPMAPQNKLEMTAWDVKVAVGSLALVPLLPMLAGLAVWWRRRA